MLEVILKTIEKVGNEVGNILTNNQEKILEEMKLNHRISAQVLSDKVGISKRKIEENIAKLKTMNRIVRKGGTRGYWEVRDL